MNKLKKIILIIAMTLFVTNTMVAKVNVDMAMNYQSTSEDEKGKVTANEYPFSVVFLPSFSKGSFFLELRAPFSFGINNNSISFDNSYYLIPEKETGESEFSFITKNLTYYLSFINYIKYGYDWNDFNFTFGTIRNATIGDGAIIYHYRDSDFVAYERKSGLKFKLDGNLINLGYVGIEGISNDLFNSDFYGGRVFVRPFYKSSSMLSETQLGLTVINYNSVNSPSVDVQYQSLALDVNQLLYKNDNNSISFYYDLISEINTVDTSNFEDKKSIGWRVGLNGRYLSKMNYNIYFKSITDPTVDNKGVDLGENLVQLIS
ncbi:MAG: hypothetical protein JJE21_09665, partial [Spirochaetaceae bacterium]|nr:hypothetical protein [Spirochaetaceae bacterium]